MRQTAFLVLQPGEGRAGRLSPHVKGPPKEKIFARFFARFATLGIERRARDAKGSQAFKARGGRAQALKSALKWPVAAIKRALK